MEILIAFFIGLIVGFAAAWLLRQKSNTNPEIMRILDDRMLAGFKVMSADILKQQTIQSRELVVAPAIAEIQKIKSEFDAKINDMNKEVIISRGSMSEYMKIFAEFANAFRNRKKDQGNWGEAILESTLDLIGFRKGFEYDTQITVTGENGEKFFLDCVLNLPDNKKVIIDSKVSFNSFMDYTNAVDELEKQTCMAAMLEATKKHIKGLADKEYQSKLKNYNLDFIFMLVPREDMYFAILEQDPGIHEYAFKNNIAIVTPSLLYPMMRTIDNLLKIDKQGKNIQDVIEMVNKLYEKYAGFTENFADIGKKLTAMTASYDDAHKQLISGNGNIGGWFEKIKKKSGIQSAKKPAITAITDE